MAVWKIQQKIASKASSKRRAFILKSLLKNRGLTTTAAVKAFLKPPHPEALGPHKVGVDTNHLRKTVKRLKEAIVEKTPIIVYGDYDADGVCSTAILWETLYKLGATVLPFIPERLKHGYGLSKPGIDEIVSKPNRYGVKPLIITVDNGIVAEGAVAYAQTQGLTVIITDHHVPGKHLPKAYAIIHTLELSGSGVAWFLAKELIKFVSASHTFHTSRTFDTLPLAAIGSVSDMVPLLGVNRSLVKQGLKELPRTERTGIKALLQEAGLVGKKLGVYEVNFMIAPRINAMGRIGSAMDSLRLLCTPNRARALELAGLVGRTNRDRQGLTNTQTIEAKAQVKDGTKDKIIIVGGTTYHEGVIGLIAGKLVEHYWRPAVVVSEGKTFSKGSARSIPGFNIIQALRRVSDLLVDVGGHPMAAGFTIDNKNLGSFEKRLKNLAAKKITAKQLEKTLPIDCELHLSDITPELWENMMECEPFGIGNPRPRFATRNVQLIEVRAVGAQKQHLRLRVAQDSVSFSAIGFGMGKLEGKLKAGDRVAIAYVVEENQWNGRTEFQLNLKDIRFS